MTKKILIFHPTIAPYRIDLFNSLHKEFNIRVCLAYENLRDQKFNYDWIYNKFLFKPIYLSHLATIRNRYLCGGYWRHIKEFNPDIVIVSEFGLDAIATVCYKKLFRKKFEIISICDDSFDMLVSDDDFSKAHKYLRKILVPHLSNLILVQPESRKWYLENYNKGIFFPIIADDGRIRAEYKKALDKSNGLIDRYSLINKKVILFVGRLIGLKNVSFLINNYSDMNMNNCVLVIVGDGEEYVALKDSAKNNRNIIFTGRLENENLFAWYNIANIFVLPSLKEPFGAVTNEALLGGCYALISDKAGSACLINGKNGKIFSPDDNNDFRMKLSDLLLESKPIEYLSQIRESKMPNTYEHYFASLLEQLNL